MSLEIEILNALIQKYENSKVSKGQNKVRVKIELPITHSVFNGHRNNDNGELDLAIQRMERDGFAFPVYTRDGQLQSLLLNLDEKSIDKLYVRLKRRNPKYLIEEYKKLFKSQSGGCQIVNSFCQGMLLLLEDKKLSQVEQYVSSEGDLLDICKAINEMSKLDADVQERIFCAKVFSDSKRFNDLRSRIAKIIREFSEEPFEEEDDVIAIMGVIRNTAYAFVKGNLVLKVNNQIIDLNEYKEPLALSDSAIENLEIIETKAIKLFTIENLTSFDVFNENNSVIVYLAGYHNKTKRALIEKISKHLAKADYYHYGDIDAGGFYILNHLRKKTGIHFEPYKMGIEQLKEFQKNCKALTTNDRKRLEKMLVNEEFKEFNDVISYMLNNNVKLEQEAEN